MHLAVKKMVEIFSRWLEYSMLKPVSFQVPVAVRLSQPTEMLGSPVVQGDTVSSELAPSKQHY